MKRSQVHEQVILNLHINIVPYGENFTYFSRIVQHTRRSYSDEIIAAMREIWRIMKIIVEPSSATVLAAVRSCPEAFKGRKVGLILSGGNVDLDHLPWMAGRSDEAL